MASTLQRHVFQKFLKQNKHNFNLLTYSVLRNNLCVRHTRLVEVHSGIVCLSNKAELQGLQRKTDENHASNRTDDTKRNITDDKPMRKEKPNIEEQLEEKTPDAAFDERVLSFKFGDVRFDNHNVITHHGQYENDPSLEVFSRRNLRGLGHSLRRNNKHENVESTTGMSSKNSDGHSETQEISNCAGDRSPSDIESTPGVTSESRLGYIDKQYFSSKSIESVNENAKQDYASEHEENIFQQNTRQSTLPNTALYRHSNFIDEQYFSELFTTSVIVDIDDTVNSQSGLSATNVNNSADNAVDSNALNQIRKDTSNSKNVHFKSREHILSVSRQQEHNLECDPFHIGYITSKDPSAFSLHPEKQAVLDKHTSNDVNFAEEIGIPRYMPVIESEVSQPEMNLSRKTHFTSKERKILAKEKIGIDPKKPGPFSDVQNKNKTSHRNLSGERNLNRLSSDSSQLNTEESTKFLDSIGAGETNKSFSGSEQSQSKSSGHTRPKNPVKKNNSKEFLRTLSKKETAFGKESSESMSAYDYVKQKRKEEKLGASKTDRKNASDSTEALRDGHHVLKNQVQDLRYLPKDIVLHILKCSVIYKANGIVAFNKPYGLASCGDESKTLGRSLSTFLEELANYLDPENPKAKLYPIHRLDRDTTGVHLFAQSVEMARILHDMFKERKIQKTYWAITRGIPDPKAGIINIPIMKGKVEERDRMVLFPELSQDLKPFNHIKGDASAATTYYKTLSFLDNAALLELSPETGIKHQVRVHLGFGLNCPVLGDHKYSNLRKLVPQKLPGDMLTKLNIRQSKARYVPLHLHAKQLIIPDAVDGKPIIINAKLPNHFVDNLKALGLKNK